MQVHLARRRIDRENEGCHHHRHTHWASTMTITLTAEIEKGLVEQAEKLGKSPEALAIEALRDRFASSISDLDRQKLENLRRLCQKLDAFPTATLSDGLSNRDHDRILYGGCQ
jgi:hypothetical protein